MYMAGNAGQDGPQIKHHTICVSDLMATVPHRPAEGHEGCEYGREPARDAKHGLPEASALAANTQCDE